MAIQVGDQAPDFALPSRLGVKTILSDELKSGPAVLAFYFFAFTGG
jgi:peroxiredoxin